MLRSTEAHLDDLMTLDWCVGQGGIATNLSVMDMVFVIYTLDG